MVTIKEKVKDGDRILPLVFYPMAQTALGLDLHEVSVNETAPKRGGG